MLPGSQVMVPGKQNYSLTIAWHLPYDPVSAVNQALMRIPEEEGELRFPYNDLMWTMTLQSIPHPIHMLCLDVRCMHLPLLSVRVEFVTLTTCLFLHPSVLNSTCVTCICFLSGAVLFLLCWLA